MMLYSTKIEVDSSCLGVKVMPTQQKFIIKAQNSRYLIDGVQAPELELISGKEYSFDLSDSSLS